MSKIINAIIIGLLGGGCFSAGIYYATLEFENQVNVWDSNYQIITDKVYAFEKVSDPKTIRLYVKELNKILDDIKFLGKIVESGQISDNTLDSFIDKHQKRIGDINGRILLLQNEIYDVAADIRTSLINNTNDLNSIVTAELKINRKFTEEQIEEIIVKIDNLINYIDEVRAELDIIKDSKVGKRIFE
tara:strand:- start:142 stop:705 length:564 start_codon:yes stop_codon:yes gene_type:complete